MAINYYQQHRPREATITVSRSPDFSGDFIGDGTADDVEIQAAIDFVDALGGGTVYIEQGSYDITAAVIWRGNVWIEGAGQNSTILDQGYAGDIIQAEAGVQYFAGMRKIKILGDKVTYGAGMGINVASTTFNDVYIEDIFIDNTPDDCLRTRTMWGWRIVDSVFEHSGQYGVQLNGGTGTITGCKIAVNELSGLWLNNCDDTRITNNFIYLNDFHGIISTPCTHCLITDNEIIDNSQEGLNNGIGIFLTTTSTYNIVTGNNIEGALIRGAYEEDAAVDDYNIVFHNYYGGRPVVINGLNTRIPTKIFQFIQGTTFISADGSAKGWEINAEADWAVTLPQLPTEVQQVVRLKIWAVALDAPPGSPGYMHLDILFNGGGSLEDYNEAANSWTLANFNGEEADYANGKVIHWVVEGGDVGNELRNLLGGDSLELKVNGGTAVGDNGATNAVLKALEIEFV